MKWLVVLSVALSSAIAAEPEIQKGDVVVVPINGPISEAQFYFLRRAVKQADASDASALILDIDTPGGELAATEKMCDALLKAGMPVYSYVNPNAASAGALIAMSTSAIYMAPVSAIGAAAPVLSSGQEIGETMNAKVVSYYSGFFRSVATQHGHNPELVDAFMNLDKEIKIGDRVLNPKGAILTLSAQEAVEVIDGRPLLAVGIAASVEALVQDAGFGGHPIVHVEPSGFESLSQWITMLAPMFLLGGIIGAYLEFKSPGFGVAGVLSGLCFLIFFTGHYIAGLTGFEAVAVFFLGLLLVLAEMIFFPGVVVVAAFGTMLMMGALLFTMVDYYPGQPFSFSLEMLIVPAANLAIALTLSAIIGALIARFLPDMPLFRRVILSRHVAVGPSIPSPGELPSHPPVSVGDTGTAYSLLRPAGKAWIGSELVDVATEGVFIPKGTPIRVLRVGGDGVVVEELTR